MTSRSAAVDTPTGMKRLISKSPGMLQCRGFSLIELVSVMVLIGILAVYIAPKMMGSSGYEQYVVRDQLISAIRFAQQHAMFDQASGRCYRLTTTAHGYAVERSIDSGANFSPMADLNLATSDSSVSSALNKVTLPVLTQRFNALGSPVSNVDALGNAVADCSGVTAATQAVNIAGSATIPLCIYSTGYVRAGTCI